MIIGKNKSNDRYFISIWAIFLVGILVLTGFSGLLILILNSPGTLASEDGMPSSRGNTIISTDTTWNITNSPYNFTGNVLVKNGVTLTIDPCVVVKFGTNNYLQVEGKLIAEGTKNNMITFTSNKANPSAWDWEYIKFMSNADNGSSFKFCRVEYSYKGIWADNSKPGALPNITNCHFDNNYEFAILLFSTISPSTTSNVLISSNTISNTKWAVVVSTYDTNVLINNNTIDKCSWDGLNCIVKDGICNLSENKINGSGRWGIYSACDNSKILNNWVEKNNIGINAQRNYDKQHITIERNEITNNGIGVKFIFDVDELNESFHYNNIYNNTQYDVRNEKKYNVTATNNWWGTTITSEIDTNIYDYYDDFNYGEVIYKPFLTSRVNITSPNTPPVAIAGSDQCVNINQTVNFDGSESYDLDNDNLNYKWDFSDGNSTDWQSSSKASHIYHSRGKYIVTLKVSDGTFIGTDTCIVWVNGPPIANAGPDQNASVNQIVYFDGSGSYDPDTDNLNYKWNFGDGNITDWQNSSNASKSFSKAGIYIVGLTVSDRLLTDIDYCIVNVIAPRYLTFHPIPTITLYEDDHLQDNAIDLWNYVDHNIVSKDLLNFTIIGNTNPNCGVTLDSNRYIDIKLAMNWYGDSTVTIQVSDGHFTLIQNLTIIVISVNDPPTADAGPDQNITVNQTVYFDGSGSYDIESEYLTYKWDFGDGFNTNWLNESSASHPFNEIGIYIVTLTVREVTHPPQLTDSDICIIRIIDSSVNHAPVANAGADQNITVDQLVTLNGSGSYDPDGDILSYEWTSSINGKLGIDMVIKNLEFDEGIHTITLKVSDGELSDTDTCIVRVSDIEGNLPPVARIKPLKIVLQGEIIRVSGAESYDEDGYIVQYYWDFGDGAEELSTESVVEHKWKQVGPCTITLIVTDDDGSTGTTSLDIYITKSDSEDVDGDGLPNVWEIHFGLDPFNPTDAQLDTDGDYLTNLDEYLLGTDPTKFDTDNDGVVDNVDAFPTDPAASIDSDSDKYPDSWNHGMSEDDSTTGLKLDAYPNDPNKFKSEIPEDETTQDNTFAIILVVIVIIILLLIAISRSFLIHSKRQREKRQYPDDEILNNVKNKISQGEPLKELEYSWDEIDDMLERTFKSDQISENTYNLIRSEILYSDEKEIVQNNNSFPKGKD